MRSIYLQHVQNLPNDIPKQVADLNYRVLVYGVYEEILPKVKGYSTFLRDNLNTNVVLDRPKYFNQSGSRINRGFSDLI